MYSRKSFLLAVNMLALVVPMGLTLAADKKPEVNDAKKRGDWVTVQGQDGLWLVTPSSQKTHFHHYAADMPIETGTAKERTQHTSLDRKRNYFFPSATVAKDTLGKLSLVRNDSDPFLIEEQIADGRVKSVDCREVAMNMVEQLMNHSVTVDHSDHNRDRETRFYQKREDTLEKLLIAKQIQDVKIVHDPVRGSGFQCLPGFIGKEKAECKTLTVFFNPAKKQVFFNEAACIRKAKLKYMGALACENLVQVEGCGLRYVLKAHSDEQSSPATWGLADLLEKNKNEAMEDMNNGTFDIDESEGVPSDFYNEFKNPGSNAVK